MSGRFEELRELCTAAGDKASLAIGMAGLVMEHVIRGRQIEASQLASENMALIESIGDPALTVALSFTSCVAKIQVAEMEDVLRWSQAVIDLAEGAPVGESIILGDPVAVALAFRGVSEWVMGLPGWREDMQRAIEMGRASDPISYSAAVIYSYNALSHRVLLADDDVLTEIGVALQMADRSAEDISLVLIRMTMGIALVEADAADADRGYDLLAEMCETCMEEKYALNVVAPLQMYAARQMFARGEHDASIAEARSALDELFSSRNLFNCDVGTNTLVEVLIARGTVSDLKEAHAATERLAETLPASRWALRDIYVLRLRALLADARGDETAYRDLRDRYRAMANELGFEGHIKWAAEMP